MNLFLEQQYEYIILKPIEQVRSQLNSITRTPWYDIAVNLAGKIFEDNTFELYSKLSLGITVFNMVQNTAIITGNLEPKGHEQTIVQIKVRPNYVILFVLYLLFLIFLFKITDSFISGRYDWIGIAILAVICLFLRSLIHYSMAQLRNRFERMMSVIPEK